jgi:hypothetical protein
MHGSIRNRTHSSWESSDTHSVRVKAKSCDQLLEAICEPVRFAGHSFAAFHCRSLRSIKYKYGSGTALQKPSKSIEERSELRIFACLRVVMEKDCLALVEPDTRVPDRGSTEGTKISGKRCTPGIHTKDDRT